MVLSRYPAAQMPSNTTTTVAVSHFFIEKPPIIFGNHIIYYYINFLKKLVSKIRLKNSIS
jgi:hypothetical protein